MSNGLSTLIKAMAPSWTCPARTAVICPVYDVQSMTRVPDCFCFFERETMKLTRDENDEEDDDTEDDEGDERQ